MIGSMTGAVIAMLSGVTDSVPYGGPVTWLCLAIVIGSTVTALLVNLLKKKNKKQS